MKRLVLIAFLVAVLIPSAAFALPHRSTRYTRSLIRSTAKAAHYGPKQTAALVTLAYRESSWHNWSRSSGGRCLGTFQLSRSMCVGRPWWKPGWNTRRAIRYIKHRYGKPTRALAHSYSRGWY